jgi:hypothetical protein
MSRTGVAIYMNVARDGDSPAWLRIGTGWLRPDGSLVAHLVHLPADGRVRLQSETVSGDAAAAIAGDGPPVRPPRPARAKRGPPPLPAVRRGPARSPEVTPW